MNVLSKRQRRLKSSGSLAQHPTSWISLQTRIQGPQQQQEVFYSNKEMTRDSKYPKKTYHEELRCLHEFYVRFISVTEHERLPVRTGKLCDQNLLRAKRATGGLRPTSVYVAEQPESWCGDFRHGVDTTPTCAWRPNWTRQSPFGASTIPCGVSTMCFVMW